MAMQRFPLKKYASVELNQVGFPKTGLVVSQTPLGVEFTEDAPCENGMWVLADKARGYIGSAAATTDSPIGIVYTSEKEYDMNHYGLNTFGRKIQGDCPRVGIFALGDTITSNCFQYDTTEFATVEALMAACAAYETTPLYVTVVANSPVPKLTKTKPASGCYAKVTKCYTVPNGEAGLKYQIVHL